MTRGAGWFAPPSAFARKRFAADRVLLGRGEPLCYLEAGSLFCATIWATGRLEVPAIAIPPGRRRITQRPDGSQLALEIVRTP